MFTYLLKQGLEVVNKTEAEDYEEALQYFSIIKKLPKNELLKIYKIEKE